MMDEMKETSVKRLWGVSLMAAVCGAAFAQEAPRPQPPPPADALARRIVLPVAGGDRVVARRNLSYRASGEGDVQLPLDVYTPAGLQPGERRPAVIFIHGGPLPPAMSPPDWGVYRSYGELAATSGLVGITFKHRLNSPSDYGRAADDVRALIAHVRNHAAEFHVDGDRLALWAFSGGGALIGVAFQEPLPYVRCVVSYYGLLDLRPPQIAGMPTAVPEPVASQLSPTALITTASGPFPPTLIARAGLDNPRLNQSVDEFVSDAEKRGIDLDLLTVPQGRHAFDILDDAPRSREVIERTIAFLRANLERVLPVR